MPDWTYHPLRPIADAVLGVRRSRLVALRALAAVGRLPGGRGVVARALGHRHPPAHLAGSIAGIPIRVRLGAVVPPSVAVPAVRALPLVGAGLLEIAPVGPGDVETVRAAARGRRVPVIVRTDDPEVAAALVDHVDGVKASWPVTHTADPDTTDAATALTGSDAIVLARPEVLLHAGPGWYGRVIEAATPTSPPSTTIGRNPLRWPPWWWGALVGLGMVVAGLGAAAITLGPVLLWYDRDLLGTDLAGLHAVNHHLVGFLQHDRITMAGTMVTIGVLYTALALGGLRRGHPWARDAYAVSGWIGFSTLVYFIGLGFVEPLHTAVAVVLFPMFLAATLPRTDPPQWTTPPTARERERRWALVGQLLLVVTGIGLFIGGAVVSLVGLSDVFVASDLTYLGVDAGTLSDRLVAFVAHDRAGFGGALLSAAVAITLLSAWGWRPGAVWVWWSLAVAAATGFLPAVLVHSGIHYTDFWHLAPVYAGIGFTALGLALSYPYLCARGTTVVACRTPGNA
ncbi:hypothetical protein V5P93_003419 [Actinokineospora auranticolor]|uniref:Uncharacterized protein n=1 Tax=Actinokineospora auranticolor TaxID=155976 RepID=A0A2S6GPI0_9PSEU|nr:hypothetical protein [Actinokineospora auranticolor]PPK67080.1 hypothetical protein CLV40_10877 [Actinokineospora auranticolor]